MLSGTQLTALLGIEHPILHGACAGHGPGVELAARVSVRGGLGAFGLQNLDGDQIRHTVREIRARTSRPFAATLWVPRDEEADAARAGPDRVEQLDAVLAARPPVFSFVFGQPSERVLALCRERGIITIGSADSVAGAMALERAGVDCVVASGHRVDDGSEHAMRAPMERPMNTFALLCELVACVRVPVVAAGGIEDLRGVTAALALGAQGVQLDAPRPLAQLMGGM